MYTSATIWVLVLLGAEVFGRSIISVSSRDITNVTDGDTAAIAAPVGSITDVAGRYALALPGIETNFNNNVTKAFLEEFYPGYTDAEQAASFSFQNGVIAVAGYYYVQGSKDVNAAVDACNENTASNARTIKCLNSVLVSMVGHGMAFVGGGIQGDTLTEMIGRVSEYAGGLPKPPTLDTDPSPSAAQYCPKSSTPWRTVDDVRFTKGWACTATITKGCPSYIVTRPDVLSAERTMGSLARDMQFVGGSMVQFTVYNHNSGIAITRQNLVLIHGGNLCTGRVTGKSCRF